MLTRRFLRDPKPTSAPSREMQREMQAYGDVASQRASQPADPSGGSGTRGGHGVTSTGELCGVTLEGFGDVLVRRVPGPCAGRPQSGLGWWSGGITMGTRCLPGDRSGGGAQAVTTGSPQKSRAGWSAQEARAAWRFK